MNQRISTWIPGSELSRLNRHPIGVPFPLAPPLCRLFSELFHWNLETGSAFDPAIGALVNVYRNRSSQDSGIEARLDLARRSSGMRHLEFRDQDCSVLRRRPVLMDPGAFGKGEAPDRVREHSRNQGDPPWLIDLGGQFMTWGTPPGEPGWRVEIADPDLRPSR